jgi:hypothetical protein
MSEYTTRVAVWQITSYDNYDLSSIGTSIMSAMARVPPEYRDKIQSDDNGEYFSLEFYYYRPETPEETAARDATNAQYAAERDERDRREYERLKAKYGS